MIKISPFPVDSSVPPPTRISQLRGASYTTPREQLDYQDIPINNIVLGNYQRPLNENRAQRMAMEFDVNRMQPISVSERGGKYFVYDGQHRVRMYRILGKSTIPAVVRHNLTYAQEAKYFAEQRKNTGAIRLQDTWNAKIEAKDHDTLEMINIAAVHGYIISTRSSTNPRHLNCLRTLENAYRKVGEVGFNRIFLVMEECFGSQPRAISSNIVEGLTEFIAAYDNDPSVVCPVSWNRVYKVLSTISPVDIIREANAYRIGNYAKSSNNGKRIAKVFVRLYNKGTKKQESRLVDAFTDI